MHKKLAEDLTSLAHSILRMKDKDDVFALKSKAYEVYEKLALLAYVEEYINTTPNAEYSKEELISKITDSSFVEEDVKVKEEEIIEAQKEPVFEIVNDEGDSLEEISNESITFEKVDEPKNTVSEIEEQPFDELQELLFGEPEKESVESPVEAPEVVEEVETITEKVEEPVINEVENKIPTLEDELGDTISVDVIADLFEKVEPKKTLHDKLQNTIKVDLNDRIAFVKNLFNGNQEDFNRVLSQLNTANTEKEAKDFINNMVKPDYDWSDKEEYEVRLLEIIERKFIV